MVERRSSKKLTQLGNKEDQNPRKFYSRLLFKALILAVFCSIVPVFLSQTPELANQTRLLELLHLVFVGLAVSYGLFSRRNYDGGGGSSDNDHRADHNNTNNPHAYVPKLLEVSSVFNVGHESESEPSDDSSSSDRRKIQTWRNRYQMKSPEVVLSNRENQTRFVDRVSSGVREKPLLLPVRSLNYSRVTDHSGGGPWERVRSKRELLKSLGDDDNSDVLPSPIPWRSRSSSSSSTEVESQTSIENLATVESQPLIKNLTSSSPRKSTSLPKLTTESVVETDEDVVRKQRFRPSPSPPSPPPPPPLPAFYNSASRKDNSPGVNRIVESRESFQKKKFSGGEFHPPPPPPPPPPPMDYYKSPPAKLRASSERRKSSEQKMKRNSTKKVWWSDPIAESKELRVTRGEDMEKNDGRGFLGSKAIEESEDEERRRREAEVHEDDEHSEVEEKKIEDEGACGNTSDVDKKADEFIAKFREQIRLQRIESIKRSTNKISANSSK